MAKTTLEDLPRKIRADIVRLSPVLPVAANRQALIESIAVSLVRGCAFEMAVEPRTDLVAKFSHDLAALLRPDEDSS